MDLQSRIRAFASWLKAHEEELRADPEGIQEGTALLGSAVSGECVVQDDVLHFGNDCTHDVSEYGPEHLVFRAEVVVQCGAVDAYGCGNIAHAGLYESFL